MQKNLFPLLEKFGIDQAPKCALAKIVQITETKPYILHELSIRKVLLNTKCY